MNTQHTPAPWKVNENGWVIGANGETIVSHHPMTYLDETAQADARLIATAPELLAALKEYVDRHEAAAKDPSELEGLPEYEKACAAIAKATQS